MQDNSSSNSGTSGYSSGYDGAFVVVVLRLVEVVLVGDSVTGRFVVLEAVVIFLVVVVTAVVGFLVGSAIGFLVGSLIGFFVGIVGSSTGFVFLGSRTQVL